MKPGRSLEARAEADAIDTTYCLAQPAFVYYPGPSPGVALPPIGWALPHEAPTRKIPYRLTYGSVLWRFPLPQMTLAYVKLTNKNKQTNKKPRKQNHPQYLLLLLALYLINILGILMTGFCVCVCVFGFLFCFVVFVFFFSFNLEF